jgi:hypothetical protein
MTADGAVIRSDAIPGKPAPHRWTVTDLLALHFLVRRGVRTVRAVTGKERGVLVRQ